MPDAETVKWFLETFGWPGLIYGTVVYGANRVWQYYTTTGRADRLAKLKADQEYRMAHTVKMDTLAHNVSQLTKQSERHSASIDKMRDAFLQHGISVPKEY